MLMELPKSIGYINLQCAQHPQDCDNVRLRGNMESRNDGGDEKYIGTL